MQRAEGSGSLEEILRASETSPFDIDCVQLEAEPRPHVDGEAGLVIAAPGGVPGDETAKVARIGMWRGHEEHCEGLCLPIHRRAAKVIVHPVETHHPVLTDLDQLGPGGRVPLRHMPGLTGGVGPGFNSIAALERSLSGRGAGGIDSIRVQPQLQSFLHCQSRIGPGFRSGGVASRHDKESTHRQEHG